MDRPSLPIFLAVPFPAVNGITTYSLYLARGLARLGYPTRLLLTEADTRLASYHERALELPDDVRVERLPVGRLDGWGAHWGALIRLLHDHAPCVYIPNSDFRHSVVCPALGPEVIVVGVAHADEPLHYDHVARLGHTWNRIVCVSGEVAARLRERHAELGPRILAIRNGIETPDAYPEGRRFDGPLELVYHGSFKQQQKRILDFPELVWRIRARGIDARLTLFGSGPDEAALREASRELVAEGALVIEPPVPNEALRRRLRDFHVYLLNSEFEGMPQALLEAMSQGCVPVVTDVSSGTREVVRDGENGFLVQVGDFEAFADRVAALDADRAQLERLSRRAYAALGEHALRLDDMARAYDALFQELVAEQRAGGFARRPGPLAAPAVSVGGLSVFPTPLRALDARYGRFPSWADVGDFEWELFCRGREVVERLRRHPVYLALRDLEGAHSYSAELAVELAAGLRRRGCDVRLLSLRPARGPALEPPAGVPLELVCTERGVSWAGAAGRLLRLLAERGPCSYVAFDRETACLAARLDGRVRSAVLAHGDDVAWLRESELPAHLDGLVLPSPAAEAAAFPEGPPASLALAVIPFPLHALPALPERGAQPLTVLIYLGQFDGLPLEPAAARAVLAALGEGAASLRFRLALPPEQVQAGQALLRALPAHVHAEVVEIASGAQLRAQLAAAELLLVPTAFPEISLVFLDALGHGCLPVGVRSPGLEQALPEELGSHLVEESTPRALAERVLALAADRARLALLAEALRARIAQHNLAPDETAERWLRLLARVWHASGEVERAGPLYPPYPEGRLAQDPRYGRFLSFGDVGDFEWELFCEGQGVLERQRAHPVLLAVRDLGNGYASELALELAEALCGDGCDVRILCLLPAPPHALRAPPGVTVEALCEERHAGWAGAAARMLRRVEAEGPCTYVAFDRETACLAPRLGPAARTVVLAGAGDVAWLRASGLPQHVDGLALASLAAEAGAFPEGPPTSLALATLPFPVHGSAAPARGERFDVLVYLGQFDGLAPDASAAYAVFERLAAAGVPLRFVLALAPEAVEGARRSLAALAKGATQAEAVPVAHASELRPHLAACHALLLPRALPDVSAVVLDALGHGCLPVGVRAPGLEKVLPEELAGYLAPTDDPGALAERVCALLAERDRLPGLAEHVRGLIQSRHLGPAEVAERWRRLLARVWHASEQAAAPRAPGPLFPPDADTLADAPVHDSRYGRFSSWGDVGDFEWELFCEGQGVLERQRAHPLLLALRDLGSAHGAELALELAEALRGEGWDVRLLCLRPPPADCLAVPESIPVATACAERHLGWASAAARMLRLVEAVGSCSYVAFDRETACLAARLPAAARSVVLAERGDADWLRASGLPQHVGGLAFTSREAEALALVDAPAQGLAVATLPFPVHALAEPPERDAGAPCVLVYLGHLDGVAFDLAPARAVLEALPPGAMPLRCVLAVPPAALATARDALGAEREGVATQLVAVASARALRPLLEASAFLLVPVPLPGVSALLLDALGHGCLPVGVASPGLRGALPEELAVGLVEAADPAALAARLRALADAPERCRALGELARTHTGARQLGPRAVRKRWLRLLGRVWEASERAVAPRAAGPLYPPYPEQLGGPLVHDPRYGRFDSWGDVGDFEWELFCEGQGVLERQRARPLLLALRDLGSSHATELALELAVALRGEGWDARLLCLRPAPAAGALAAPAGVPVETLCEAREAGWTSAAARALRRVRELGACSYVAFDRESACLAPQLAGEVRTLVLAGVHDVEWLRASGLPEHVDGLALSSLAAESLAFPEGPPATLRVATLPFPVHALAEPAQRDESDELRVLVYLGHLDGAAADLAAARAVLEALGGAEELRLHFAVAVPAAERAAAEQALRGLPEGVRAQAVAVAGGEALRAELAKSQLLLLPAPLAVVSLAVLDALGHGCLPVGVRSPGLEAALPEELSVGLVDAAEPGALAERIRVLAGERPRLRVLGERARELVHKVHPGPRAVRERWLRLLGRVWEASERVVAPRAAGPLYPPYPEQLGGPLVHDPRYGRFDSWGDVGDFEWELFCEGQGVLERQRARPLLLALRDLGSSHATELALELAVALRGEGWDARLLCLRPAPAAGALAAPAGVPVETLCEAREAGWTSAAARALRRVRELGACSYVAFDRESACLAPQLAGEVRTLVLAGVHDVEWLRASGLPEHVDGLALSSLAAESLAFPEGPPATLRVATLPFPVHALAEPAQRDESDELRVLVYLGHLDGAAADLAAARAVLEALGGAEELRLHFAVAVPAAERAAAEQALRGLPEGVRAQAVAVAGGEALRAELAKSQLLLLPAPLAVVSLAVLDALGHGCLPVGVRSPGLEAALPEELSVGLVDAAEPGALAERIRVLAGERPRLRVLGERARELVHKVHPGPRAVRERWLRLLGRVWEASERVVAPRAAGPLFPPYPEQLGGRLVDDPRYGRFDSWGDVGEFEWELFCQGQGVLERQREHPVWLALRDLGSSYAAELAVELAGALRGEGWDARLLCLRPAPAAGALAAPAGVPIETLCDARYAGWAVAAGRALRFFDACGPCTLLAFDRETASLVPQLDASVRTIVLAGVHDVEWLQASGLPGCADGLALTSLAAESSAFPDGPPATLCVSMIPFPVHASEHAAAGAAGPLTVMAYAGHLDGMVADPRSLAAVLAALAPPPTPLHIVVASAPEDLAASRDALPALPAGVTAEVVAVASAGELRSYLDSARLLLVPRALPTISLVVLDALAQGCVPVGVRSPGLERALGEGMHVGLVEGGSPAALAERLLELAGSPERLRALSERARDEQGRTHPGPREVAARWLRLLGRVWDASERAATPRAPGPLYPPHLVEFAGPLVHDTRYGRFASWGDVGDFAWERSGEHSAVAAQRQHPLLLALRDLGSSYAAEVAVELAGALRGGGWDARLLCLRPAPARSVRVPAGVPVETVCERREVGWAGAAARALRFVEGLGPATYVAFDREAACLAPRLPAAVRSVVRADGCDVAWLGAGELAGQVDGLVFSSVYAEGQAFPEGPPVPLCVATVPYPVHVLSELPASRGEAALTVLAYLGHLDGAALDVGAMVAVLGALAGSGLRVELALPREALEGARASLRGVAAGVAVECVEVASRLELRPHLARAALLLVPVAFADISLVFLDALGHGCLPVGLRSPGLAGALPEELAVGLVESAEGLAGRLRELAGSRPALRALAEQARRRMAAQHPGASELVERWVRLFGRVWSAGEQRALPRARGLLFPPYPDLSDPAALREKLVRIPELGAFVQRGEWQEFEAQWAAAGETPGGRGRLARGRERR